MCCIWPNPWRNPYYSVDDSSVSVLSVDGSSISVVSSVVDGCLLGIDVSSVDVDSCLLGIDDV